MQTEHQLLSYNLDHEHTEM